MFVGREEQLNYLNERYNEKSFYSIIIYGRKYIGKTALISEFVKGKPGIYFTAQEILDRKNLQLFSKKVYTYFNIMNDNIFSTWKEAFNFINLKAREQQLVLVIDEAGYIAKSNPLFMHLLLNYMEHWFKDTKLFLILCTSHENFILNHNLNEKFNGQIKLEEFDYQDAFSMLGGFSLDDKIKIYASVGGMPHFLSLINKSETYEENMKRLYFHISGFLYNEVSASLMDEVREPCTYNSILAAIASGASKFNEIVADVGEERTKVSKYLSNLISLNIVEKQCPFGEDPVISRKSTYRLKNFSYYFWYRFVLPFKSYIEEGNGNLAANQVLYTEQLTNYINNVAFKEICLQYLKNQNKKKLLPFHAEVFGSDPKSDCDIIAADSTNILLGKCKWQNYVLDSLEIENIIKNGYLEDKYKGRYHYIFTKSQIFDKAFNMAEDISTLTLVRIKDVPGLENKENFNNEKNSYDWNRRNNSIKSNRKRLGTSVNFR